MTRKAVVILAFALMLVLAPFATADESTGDGGAPPADNGGGNQTASQNSTAAQAGTNSTPNHQDGPHILNGPIKVGVVVQGPLARFNLDPVYRQIDLVAASVLDMVSGPCDPGHPDCCESGYHDGQAPPPDPFSGEIDVPLLIGYYAICTR
jgi:hypothetical protein